MAAELKETVSDHLMQIMDIDAGHNEISWDPEDPDSVAIAKQAFDKAKAKGMLIYKTTKKGEQGALMKEFDPEAERIRMSPMVKGG